MKNINELKKIESSEAENLFDEWIGNRAEMENDSDWGPSRFVKRVKAKGYYDWEDFAMNCYANLFTDGKDLYVEVGNRSQSENNWSMKQWAEITGGEIVKFGKHRFIYYSSSDKGDIVQKVLGAK